MSVLDFSFLITMTIAMGIVLGIMAVFFRWLFRINKIVEELEKHSEILGIIEKKLNKKN